MFKNSSAMAGFFVLQPVIRALRSMSLRVFEDMYEFRQVLKAGILS